MNRQEIINELNELIHDSPVRFPVEAMTGLKDALAYIEKQPKKGHWKKPTFANDRWHECSECGTVTEAVDHNGYKLICNYCPVCGTDMRKDGDQE